MQMMPKNPERIIRFNYCWS